MIVLRRLTWRERLLDFLQPRRRRARDLLFRATMRFLVENPDVKVYVKE